MTRILSIPADEKVACPHCGKEFELSLGIAEQVLDRYAAANTEQQRRLEADLRSQAEKEAASRLEHGFQKKVAGIEAKLAEAQGELEEKNKEFAERLAREKSRAAETARQELEAVSQELAEKSEALAEAKRQELELRKERQALETRAKDLELEVVKRVDAERAKLNQELEQSVSERFQLKLREYEKRLEDAQKANDDLARKLQQGSQQLQGESLELSLEEDLRAAFPLDRIDEVKKGKRGADLIQQVCLPSGVPCGRIVWEAKNAANWAKGWVDKLKEDQQACGAEIAVLVSTCRPAELHDPLGQHAGIWVVSPALAIPLASTLRFGLIETQKQRTMATGRDERMAALYEYLCSPQFANRIRLVVETFQSMRGDLDHERDAMERLWKRRERQLAQVIKGLLAMGGELEAISQSTLPGLAPLLLDRGEPDGEREEAPA